METRVHVPADPPIAPRTEGKEERIILQPLLKLPAASQPSQGEAGMTEIRLAPMAGITDWPFRLLCFERRRDAATTEMISALGYVYAPKNHVATNRLLEKAPGKANFSYKSLQGTGADGPGGGTPVPDRTI